MLTEGIKVTYQKDGHNRGDLVWLIDFKNPENNDFIVANQFTVIENNVNKRPDMILFVNGLPLVVIELKNPVDENATARSAFKQLQTYKQAIPSLFTYNGLMIVSDGLEAKAGSISAGFSRFMAWKTSDGVGVPLTQNIGNHEQVVKEQGRALAERMKEPEDELKLVIVKRTLRQYGYPPDMQKLATETVLKQAELIAEEIIHGE